MTSTSVLFGAGKIARGFLAHLLSVSGIRPVFVEARADLVEELRRRGRYRVHVLGAPSKDAVIEAAGALHVSETAAIADAVAAAACAFTAVGGPNLPAVGKLLAGGIERRFAGPAAHPLNVLVCENYHEPARLLRDSISAALGPERSGLLERVGIAECQVLRSSIDPDASTLASSPLQVNVQDEWRLPCDGSALVGPPPPVRGLEPLPDFGVSLKRKLFTYNASNAAVAYLGWLAGHRLLSEAANDPAILAVARGVCEEAGQALVSRHGLDPGEQRRFGEAALLKYRKVEIVDPIERNARDPIRKLSRNDRLVGPAALCLEEGIEPRCLVQAIAAALRYGEPSDPSAVALQEMRAREGLPAVLEKVCGLERGHPLAARITGEMGR